MNVLGYDPYVSVVKQLGRFSSHVKRVDDLKEIFTNAELHLLFMCAVDR